MSRYLVLHRSYFDRGGYEINGCRYEPVGGSKSVHLYSTIKNACKIAMDPHAFSFGNGKPQRDDRARSKILLFDPARLMEITADDLHVIAGAGADREDDIVIAERQIQLWSDRLRGLVEASHGSDE